MSNYELYLLLSRICVLVATLASIVSIIAVLIQPSNSNGISALGGSADTFYNKSKGKTLANKMKIWTYVCMVLTAVFMLAFFLIERIFTA